MNKLFSAGAAGYLLGSLPTSDVVARLVAKRNGDSPVDMGRAGTQNPGALNTAKVLGARWGLVVLAGDIAKGVVAALAGKKIAGANGAYSAGTAAVIGHCAPPWNGFRGGKGVATSAGTSLVCFPVYAPVDVGLAAGVLALSRGRAGIASYVASGCFVTAATFWWARRKRNGWGPEATIGLPLYAAATSAMMAYRFLMAPASDVSGSVEEAEANHGELPANEKPRTGLSFMADLSDSIQSLISSGHTSPRSLGQSLQGPNSRHCREHAIGRRRVSMDDKPCDFRAFRLDPGANRLLTPAGQLWLTATCRAGRAPAA